MDSGCWKVGVILNCLYTSLKPQIFLTYILIFSYFINFYNRYKFLNKIWKPVHKICFLETTEALIAKGPAYAQTQAQKDEDPMLKMLITSINVTDRPDLILSNRKKSMKKKSVLSQLKVATDVEAMQGKTGKNAFGAAGAAAMHHNETEDDQNTGSISSLSMDDDDDDDGIKIDPNQIALPTMMMAGTIWGEVFRADLSKNKVDVETNNLCKIIFCLFPEQFRLYNSH